MTSRTERALSIRDWLRAATEELAAAGVESPRNDAQRLAAHVLGVSWTDLWMRGDEIVDASALDEAVRRRAAGEPLAYIEGSTTFFGLEIGCGPGVLVPRPETEVLVEVVLELLEGRIAPVVLDIGTGTGAIALAIAAARPDAVVYGTDVSEVALGYARRNAASSRSKVTLSAGDLFDAVPVDLAGRLDVVVSNPPYVADGTALPADVLAEPHIALRAGPRGTDVIERIVADAPGWLRSGGALAIEIGGEQQAALLPGRELRNDLTGRPRVMWAIF